MITFIAKLYNTPPFTWSMFVLASIANKDRRILLIMMYGSTDETNYK